MNVSLKMRQSFLHVVPHKPKEEKLIMYRVPFTETMRTSAVVTWWWLHYIYTEIKKKLFNYVCLVVGGKLKKKSFSIISCRMYRCIISGRLRKYILHCLTPIVNRIQWARGLVAVINDWMFH